MSGVKIAERPPRKPLRQALYIVGIVLALAAAGVLLWFQLAHDDSKAPEELRESVRKQIRQRTRETSVKGTP